MIASHCQACSSSEDMPPRFLSASHPYVKFGSFDHGKVAACGYVILSHVWQDVEQLHEDVFRFERETTAANDPRLSVKIRECHRLARAYGFDWFWIDAPCIDQKNSVELSEAIRSMYHWYASASICFAHLPDVPSHDPIRESGSAFRRSVYFKRGWTLQELIAPPRVIFLSSEWTVLGEKDGLADLLEEITGIDQDVLTLRRPVADVSVARRLSWASLRETRRVEDQAYCLMGLFDICMPVLYGEGNKAFLRLQQTILAQICDHTLFAWGAATDMFPTLDLADVAEASLPYSTTPLFASSPAAFARSRMIHPVQIAEFISCTEVLAGPNTGCAKVSVRMNHPSLVSLIEVYLATTPLFAGPLWPEDSSPYTMPRIHSACRHPRMSGSSPFVHCAGASPQRSPSHSVRCPEPRVRDAVSS